MHTPEPCLVPPSIHHISQEQICSSMEQQDAGVATLQSLSADLLLVVAAHLSSPKDFLALRATCRSIWQPLRASDAVATWLFVQEQVRDLPPPPVLDSLMGSRSAHDHASIMRQMLTMDLCEYVVSQSGVRIERSSLDPSRLARYSSAPTPSQAPSHTAEARRRLNALSMPAMRIVPMTAAMRSGLRPSNSTAVHSAANRQPTDAWGQLSPQLQARAQGGQAGPHLSSLPPHADMPQHLMAKEGGRSETAGASAQLGHDHIAAQPDAGSMGAPPRTARCSMTRAAQSEWLCCALRLGREEAARVLLMAPGAGPDPNYADGAPLRLAAARGLAWTVETLIARGARADVQDSSALARAAEGGHADVVRLLVAAGADVRAGGDRALHAAVSSGSTAVVELLLEAGAAVSSSADYALRKAAGMGDPAMVHLLLQRGANVASGRYDALYQAARRGSEEVVQLLLDAGADITQCPDAERVAHARGHTGVAALLGRARRAAYMRSPWSTLACALGFKNPWRRPFPRA